jgi:quercetin dioxygenase-like cupin family protein
MRSLFSISLIIGLATLLCNIGYAQAAASTFLPHIVELSHSATQSMDVFHGPPETVTMRSGYMVLAPTKSVGKHSTRHNEEAVIVLQGTGEMRIVGGPTMELRPYVVAYCPPTTEHDVVNTGKDTLRYIWLVANADHR